MTPTGVYERTEAHRIALSEGARQGRTGRHIRTPSTITKLRASLMGNQKLIDARNREWALISADIRLKRMMPAILASRHANPSSIEQVLIDTFQRAGYRVEAQVQFGRFVVDCYLPDQRLALEADGEYWHRNLKKSDTARDEWLLRRFNLRVVRFTEEEIRSWTK